MTRGWIAVALAGAAALSIAGCGHQLKAPSSMRWGLPVYPGSVIVGSTNAKASFAVYSTPDSLDTVYAWYIAELPPQTPHAYSSAKHQATFALFDARARRTVHLEDRGAATAILFTDTNQ
jgi:hypothetical protein